MSYEMKYEVKSMWTGSTCPCVLAIFNSAVCDPGVEYSDDETELVTDNLEIDPHHVIRRFHEALRNDDQSQVLV